MLLGDQLLDPPKKIMRLALVLSLQGMPASHKSKAIESLSKCQTHIIYGLYIAEAVNDRLLDVRGLLSTSFCVQVTLSFEGGPRLFLLDIDSVFEQKLETIVNSRLKLP